MNLWLFIPKTRPKPKILKPQPQINNPKLKRWIRLGRIVWLWLHTEIEWWWYKLYNMEYGVSNFNKCNTCSISIDGIWYTQSFFIYWPHSDLLSWSAWSLHTMMIQSGSLIDPQNIRVKPIHSHLKHAQLKLILDLCHIISSTYFARNRRLTELNDWSQGTLDCSV